MNYNVPLNPILVIKAPTVIPRREPLRVEDFGEVGEVKVLGVLGLRGA